MVSPEFLKHFDYNVHLGDMVMTTALTAVGYGLRKMYGLGVEYMKHLKRMDRMVQRNDIITSLHTTTLHRAGLLPIEPGQMDAYVDGRLGEDHA